jgi:hypothetical protein
MSRLLALLLAVQIAPNPRCIGDTFCHSPPDFDHSAGKCRLPAEFLLLLGTVASESGETLQVGRSGEVQNRAGSLRSPS